MVDHDYIHHHQPQYWSPFGFSQATCRVAQACTMRYRCASFCGRGAFGGGRTGARLHQDDQPHIGCLRFLVTTLASRYDCWYDEGWVLLWLMMVINR